MKKRSKLWIVFLVIGVICTIITKCHNAKAESWIPPEWVDEFMDPSITPEPIETPAPTEDPAGQAGNRSADDGKSVPLNANRGYLRYCYATYTYNSSTNLLGIRPAAAFGGGTITTPRNPWFPYDGRGKEYANTVLFTSSNLLQSTNINTSPMSVQKAGIALMVQYESYDNQIWTNEYTFTVKLNWSLTCTLSLGSNAQITLEQFGFGDSVIYGMPVTVLCEFECSDGLSYWINDNITLADLTFYEGIFNAESVPDDVYIEYINLNFIVNYDWLQNYIFQTVSSYYSSAEGQQIPSSDRIYPQMAFYTMAGANISCSAAYSENAKNRSWLSDLISSIFLPDADELTALINGSIGDPSQNGSALVMQARTLLYDTLNDHVNSDFVLNVPAINIPVNGSNYTIFPGFSFNLNEFYNGGGTGTVTPSSPVFRTLMQALTFIMSCLLFSAFFQSLWALVVKVFGLHLWQGVNGEDLDEVDV